MKRLVFPVFLLVGCTPTFDTVETACERRAEPANTVDPVAYAALWRTNCYRRLAGVREARLNQFVQEGAEDHINYMLLNGVLAYQSPADPGFTGESGLDRAVANGYVHDGVYGVWDIAGTNTEGWMPEVIMDQWVESFYHRQVVLHPAWVDAGIAMRDEHVSVTVVYDLESPYHKQSPVIYPADGQLDVPTSYVHPYPQDAVPYLAEVGYPITLTFGGALDIGALQDNEFAIDLSNPLDIALGSAQLFGPSGEVGLIGVTPATGVQPLLFSLALVPDTPLEPGATYQLEVDVSWQSLRSPLSASLVTTFTTAEKESP